MKKLVLFSALAITAATASYGQSEFSEFTDNPSAFTISSDKNTLELGGRMSFYYENRFLKSGETNLKHNGFDVKDMDLDIIGNMASKFTYEVHYSLVDMVTAAATQNTAAPTSPGFKAAYIQYNGFPVKIKLGYDKVPFSQSSIMHEHETPFWSHPGLTGGDYFSRRDIGLTLNARLLKNMINLYAGAYSGMGETFFEYGNDESGRFEYVARAEFSFPGKMNYNEIDEENTPTPHFRIGANIRYKDKTQPTGSSISQYPDALGTYGLSLINGKTTVYGIDAIVKFKGLSATFERDVVNLKPASANDPIFEGTTAAVNGGKVNAGGFITDLNYDYEKWKSVLSVGYQSLNPNDLIAGHEEWLTIGYAYKVSGFNSVAKIEYYVPTLEDKTSDPLKYTGQIRVGYQVVF